MPDLIFESGAPALLHTSWSHAEVEDQLQHVKCEECHEECLGVVDEDAESQSDSVALGEPSAVAASIAPNATIKEEAPQPASSSPEAAAAEYAVVIDSDEENGIVGSTAVHKIRQEASASLRDEVAKAVSEFVRLELPALVREKLQKLVKRDPYVKPEGVKDEIQNEDRDEQQKESLLRSQLPALVREELHKHVKKDLNLEAEGFKNEIESLNENDQRNSVPLCSHAGGAPASTPGGSIFSLSCQPPGKTTPAPDTSSKKRKLLTRDSA